MFSTAMMKEAGIFLRPKGTAAVEFLAVYKMG
jgi:hypothetical protein